MEKCWKTFILSLRPPAPKFLKISEKIIDPIISLMRALHSRKLEISMTHRAKDMSENIFSVFGTPSPSIFDEFKKTCYIYSHNYIQNTIAKTRSFNDA